MPEKTHTTPNPAQQPAMLMDQWEPVTRSRIHSARKTLRERFPTAYELVYDYGRSLVIAYSPSLRGSEAIVSLSTDKSGVRLVFTQGIHLSDPHQLLQGKATLTRHIPLETDQTLALAEVVSLLGAATLQAPVPLRDAGVGELVVKASKNSKPKKSSQ